MVKIALVIVYVVCVATVWGCMNERVDTFFVQKKEELDAQTQDPNMIALVRLLQAIEEQYLTMQPIDYNYHNVLPLYHFFQEFEQQDVPWVAEFIQCQTAYYHHLFLFLRENHALSEREKKRALQEKHADHRQQLQKILRTHMIGEHRELLQAASQRRDNFEQIMSQFLLQLEAWDADLLQVGPNAKYLFSIYRQTSTRLPPGHLRTFLEEKAILFEKLAALRIRLTLYHPPEKGEPLKTYYDRQIQAWTQAQSVATSEVEKYIAQAWRDHYGKMAQYYEHSLPVFVGPGLREGD